ncbi:hypothetical protein [Butyricicoccus porcorum]|uniref:hypothetical protein n=1 Tax=Butyricicoccus porcorum TaxID=1945634 RepID=UPI0013FE28FD|nr:hypothetical protein [Butyricicoccus porcorum]
MTIKELCSQPVKEVTDNWNNAGRFISAVCFIPYRISVAYKICKLRCFRNQFKICWMLGTAEIFSLFISGGKLDIVYNTGFQSIEFAIQDKRHMP